jgi:predicted DNA-binding ribbon-helix-helix protein
MAKPRHKRSITITRHRTSVSLEDEFWDALNELARRERRSMADVIAEIDRKRSGARAETSLSAAIRLYVLKRLRTERA